MAAIDILIDQIVNSPGHALVPTATLSSRVWAVSGTDDRQWGWHDLQHDMLAGLEVIEHPEVSAALCQAVFQTPTRRPLR